MIDISLIKDNTLLIISPNIKYKILDSFNDINRLLNIKIMSFDELKKHVYFDYDINTILYLMDQYKMDRNTAQVLIKNLYYIENKEYKLSKLNELVSLKDELNKKGLLIYDDLFLNYIKSKNILVYGDINKFNLNMLSKFNYEIIKEEKVSKKLTVYECNTIESEVEFVFNKILSLIDDGVDINKIKIVNVDSKYFYTIKRLSNIFNLPVFIEENKAYSSIIVKEFLKNLNSSHSIVDSLVYIKSKYSENIELYNKILNICNKYNDLNYSFDSIYLSIKEEIKNINISSKSMNKQINIVSLEEVNDSDYVFLMNFNQKNIPKIYKDTDYISDYYKSELNIDTTEDKNNNEKEFVINRIMSIDNLIITYKLKGIDSLYYPSNLINELNMNVLKSNNDLNISYSDKYSKIKLSKLLDSFIKYGKKDNELVLLYNNYSIDYLKYSNSFTGINKKKIINKLLPKLMLSYTHINNYYHCAFKYYLTNILKLDKYEETFSIIIGNLFHDILSKMNKDDFNYDYEYDNYISKLNLKVDEAFFIIKLKEELKIVIDYISELESLTGLTKSLTEQEIYIDKSSDIPVTFMGKVDKIMYKNDIVSIVDYKTGNTDINIYNTIYGLDMQLQIYLYLVKNSNLFNNVRFSGFYLQPVLSNEVNYSINKTYLEQKQDNYKLNGYSNLDISILEKFLPDYENSRFVKGMKTNSKGFYPYTKIISDEEIDNLVKVVDSKIIEARDNILNGNFFINPKEIDNKKIGCQFCKYKDICYVREEDFVKLEKNDSLSFLGGDIND